jgi:hypothetical protein
MTSFEELRQSIRGCKTKQELDEMRLPLVRHPKSGGTIDEFYKLQKVFRTQKNCISRGTI